MAAAAAVLVACRPAAPAFTEDHARAIVDSVAATFADYQARLNARDADSASRFYAPDSTFIWLEDGMVRYRSRAEIQQALERLAAFKSVRISTDQPAIVALGPGAAALNVTFDQALVDSAGGGGALVGAMTIAVKRTPAGWKWATGQTAIRREPHPEPRRTP